MGESTMFDTTYHFIMKRMIETGVAPHHTEIASSLELPMESGRQALHDLMSLNIPGIWLVPNTDYISSFAPFSNLPTQYRITVGGEQKWYGQ